MKSLGLKYLFIIIVPILLTAQNRERWKNPEAILDSIGIKKGMIIGEIGAGDGYFTFKMVDRIGREGHIYANDILASELDKIDKKCREKGITNITTILGETDDSLLPKDTLDMIIMVYVFHHIENPVLFLNNLRHRLKPATPVVIIERDPERSDIIYNHFYKRDKILNLAHKANYKTEKIYTFLKRDNIYIFVP
ncbi:MAG: class I SAM-dependent methyltransferase [Calditrichaceae bacterium]|jgi:arsenite methyltransferase